VTCGKDRAWEGDGSDKVDGGTVTDTLELRDGTSAIGNYNHRAAGRFRWTRARSPVEAARQGS